MFCYEVRAAVEDRLRGDFEAYMLAKHIADVLETGCFVRARFESNEGYYATSYIATDKGEIDRYLEHYTEAMRDDFKVHFPVGIELSRTISEE
ncbi:MAG: DUF4286 family protein [Acidobacteria bacterium ACB1]|nr:hypothetical protein [Pyrinomonadaceae bacterium]MCE7961863.1 DUF4286 family protein [Acidobacteria bacterium ACB1]RIJ93543.1 MAG: hypothetical protein DCC44_06595 [Acidobacteriota bacterium]